MAASSSEMEEKMEELVESLIRKRYKVTEIPKWGPYMRKQWELSFANHLPDEEKRSIYLFNHDGACGYLWHLFSYEKRDCMQGPQAEQAFLDESKNQCYIFHQRLDEILLIENASSLTAEDLKSETDIYVADIEWNWTFVITHETGWCGPYFSRK